MPGAERPGRPALARRALLVGGGAFAVAAIPLAGRRGPAVARRQVPVMGTLAELVVTHETPAAAQAAIDDAIEALRRVDRAMTRHRRDSDVGRVNGAGPGRAVAIGPATAEVAREALRWAEASEGAFDPCAGRAVELWDVTARTAPPPAAAVARLAGRRLHRALEVERRAGQWVARVGDPDVALDLGGIAKGYGVDRAVEALRGHGVRHALVNVGGDLYALGTAASGRPWRIGIRSPEAPEALAGEIEVRDAAVATSGDYLQYFTHGGRRYHHLLDPLTAAPRLTTVRSVTVTAACCRDADAAATAVYGMADARAAQVLATLAPGARVVAILGERA